MKKISLLLLFIAAFSFANAQTGKDSADFKFDGSETFDFGEIPQGIPATHEFSFTNVGKEPLVISMVDKSCGCTTPKWTTEPVLPGKTGTVSATFNAAAAGEFMKTVTIHSNAKQQNKVLYIKGKVIAKPTDNDSHDNHDGHNHDGHNH